MKKFLRASLSAVILSGFFAAGADALYYENDRFGYSVDVPDGFVPRPEAPNGDGRVFAGDSPRGRIAVWGGYNALGHSLAEAANFASEGHDVVYRRLSKKGGWFALSWLDGDGRIVYLRQWLRSDGIYAVQFVYPKEERNAFDAIIRDTVKSFKIPPGAR